jgi:hypothetical protein
MAIPSAFAVLPFTASWIAVPWDIIVEAYRLHERVPPYVEDELLIDCVKDALVDLLIDWSERQIGKG